MEDPERPRVPDGMDEGDVEQRAQLAGYLGKEIWPAPKAIVLETARAQHAPEEILIQLDQLEEREYINLADVWAELGGGNEMHRN